MQISNFFVKTSALKHIGLNRFMYYENTIGHLVSPSVPSIYIVFVKDGHGHFNNQAIKAGDVIAYGFNMNPLLAEIHNVTFLGVELEFQLFYQLTGLLPSFCQDVLLLEPKNPLTRLLNDRLLYLPITEWVSQVENFVISRLTHQYKPFDTRTERLMYASKSMLQQSFISFDHLITQLGISFRALQRDFASILGITPKQYHSIHRLYKAAHYIKSNRLIEAAFLAGYADQSHMNRDFKRLAGITPYQVNLTHKSDSKLYLPKDTQSSKRSAFIIPY